MTVAEATDRVQVATAKLLIELAFMVAKGTDISKHPIAEKLKEFGQAKFELGKIVGNALGKAVGK